MLQNSWSIKLPESPLFITTSLLPEPSLVLQGSSNQLLVHKNNQTITLPIRKQVLALHSISKQINLQQKSHKNNKKLAQPQQILLLTKYSLICFDFLNNQEKFNLQFENAQQLYVFNNQWIYVICGDSLYCYDGNGQQSYVNHFTQSISCVVNKMTHIQSKYSDTKEQQIVEIEDIGSDSIYHHSIHTQIYIGFTDMTMSRYQKQNLTYDYGKVLGTPHCLCSVSNGILVGTKQGSIGYYQTKKSKWKAKSTHVILRMLQLSNKGNNNNSVIVLRQYGSIQLRDWMNGTTLSKIKIGQAIMDGFIMDYRRQGFEQILCVCKQGTVKAYNLIDMGEGTNNNQTNLDKDNIRKSTNNNVSKIGNDLIIDSNYLEILQSQRAQINYQIQKIRDALKAKDEQQEGQAPILDNQFVLKGILLYENGLIFKLNATNGYISGLTFQEPIMPTIVEKTQQLKYKFQQSNEFAGTLNCQIIVHSSFMSNKYEIRNLAIVLPKFWKWGLTSVVNNSIQGRLKFKMVERNARYIKWIKQCFFFNVSQKQEERLQSLPLMKTRFVNSYQKMQMQLVFSSKDGEVEIHCDCLKTMGDIVQDLVNYVGVKDLNTQLHLPRQKQKIKQDLATVERLSQTKISISTEMAEATNTIKFLLMKGQSARLIGSMNTFRRSFTQIMQQNNSLLIQIQKKNQNTKTLSETLKNVGQFINKIANIRYGQSKARIIAQCREAIKTKRFPQIIRLMDQGVQT